MRQVLGEEEANREIAKHMPDIQKNLSRIDASIARLRGGVPSNEGKPSAPAQLPAGWSVQVH